MIRKLSILAILWLTAVGALRAQAPVGSWTLYSPFNNVDQVVETPNRTYMVSQGSLFYFDKQTEDSGALDTSNMLHDRDIARVRYNPYGKYLMVIYTSGNIDKLYDDGRSVNISDLRDAVNAYPRTINDVAFSRDGKFYVAMTYAVVTFDDKKDEVICTVYTSTPVISLGCVGTHLVMMKEGNHMYWADTTQRLTSESQFVQAGTATTERHDFVALGDNEALHRQHTTNNYLYHVRFNWDTPETPYSQATVKDPVTNKAGLYFDVPQQRNDTTVIVSNGNVLLSFQPGAKKLGTAVETVIVPEGLRGGKSSMLDGASQAWVCNTSGLAQYDLSNPESPVQLRDFYLPSSYTVLHPHYMTPTPSGKLLVSNRMYNMAQGISLSGNEQLLTLNAIQNSQVKNITPTSVERRLGNDPGRAKNLIGTPFKVIEDPSDPDVYYISTWWEGVYRVKNGVQTNLYNDLNSALYFYNKYAFVVSEMVFDNNNNLWTIQENIPDGVVDSLKTGYGVLHMLPANKLTKAETTPEDWITVETNGNIATRNSHAIYAEKSNAIVILQGYSNADVTFYFTQGTSTTSDDRMLTYDRLVDQDSKYFTPTYHQCLVEDKLGRIWIGTSDGVYEITDPTKVTEGTTLINHLKVPRNDGTNLADYLLAGQDVLWIAVDDANRKWIATSNSGVYLVSENGDKILEHFTVDNSPLPSNCVRSVGCDVSSNAVYFGLDGALVEYRAGSAPAAADYSNVYAYPNPVRPDYTGWITVTGLMDDSLVKIADSAGNVFAQGRSEGGMFLWDGCNSAGDRVKTGVYFVYASQNGSGMGSSSGCVTKILVVN